jgi:UDP-2,3-diacylglucosamine hydrolase
LTVVPVSKEPLGLIAGSGRLPMLFAGAARAAGHPVHAVGHLGETDAGLATQVDSMAWIRVGQIDAIIAEFKRRNVVRAVMAGAIGRVRTLSGARPDRGMLRIVASLRSLRDDEFLRAIAAYFEQRGISIVAATDYVQQVVAVEGHLAGPAPTLEQEADIRLGREVAGALGRADVGQTVVVKNGVVLAVEAIEGTDEAIRRGGRLGGPGAVVVKRAKPGQDLRFDLPAAGPVTLEVMREAGAKVLAVEAGKTVLLDGALLFKWARALGISVVGIRVD